MSGTRRHNERNPGPCGPSVTDPHIHDVGGGKSPAICLEENRAVFCMWCEDRGDHHKDTAGAGAGAVGDGRTRNGAWWEGSQVSAEHRGASRDLRSRNLEGASGVWLALRNGESHNRARCVSPSSLDPSPRAKAPGYLPLSSWAILATPTTSLLLSTYNTLREGGGGRGRGKRRGLFWGSQQGRAQGTLGWSQLLREITGD